MNRLINLLVTCENMTQVLLDFPSTNEPSFTDELNSLKVLLHDTFYDLYGHIDSNDYTTDQNKIYDYLFQEQLV